MNNLNYTPVFIIGAPRSGTNILRDVLSSHPSISTWPCDELNQMWRHYNSDLSSDQFLPSHANSKVINYVRKFFTSFYKKARTPYILEKTCANSLRVSFVSAIFPEAKYIFIVRDGVDSISSARICWSTRLRPVYLLKKMRYVPFSDLVPYFNRFFFSYVKRLFAADKRVGLWGPVYDEMHNDLSTKTLLEVCALQWKHCVELSSQQLSLLDRKNIMYLSYEDLVSRPAENLISIIKFLGLDETSTFVQHSSAKFNPSSVGKGYSNINPSELEVIQSIISDTRLSHDF